MDEVGKGGAFLFTDSQFALKIIILQKFFKYQ